MECWGWWSKQRCGGLVLAAPATQKARREWRAFFDGMEWRRRESNRLPLRLRILATTFTALIIASFWEFAQELSEVVLWVALGGLAARAWHAARHAFGWICGRLFRNAGGDHVDR